jgi:hypothetical protein
LPLEITPGNACLFCHAGRHGSVGFDAELSAYKEHASSTGDLHCLAIRRRWYRAGFGIDIAFLHFSCMMESESLGLALNRR